MSDSRQEKTAAKIVETLAQLFQTKSVKASTIVKEYQKGKEHAYRTRDKEISKASQFLQDVCDLISRNQIHFTKEQWKTLSKVLDKHAKFDLIKEEKAKTGKYNYNFMNQMCKEFCLCTFDLVDRALEEKDVETLPDLEQARRRGIDDRSAETLEKLKGKTKIGSDYRADIYTPEKQLRYQLTQEPDFKDHFLFYDKNLAAPSLVRHPKMRIVDPNQYWHENFNYSTVLMTAEKAISWQQAFQFYAARKYLREYLHFQLEQAHNSKQTWTKTPPWESRKKNDQAEYKEYLKIEKSLYAHQKNRIIKWLTKTQSYLEKHPANDMKKNQLALVKRVLEECRKHPHASLRKIWLREEKHCTDPSTLLPPPGSSLNLFNPHDHFLSTRHAVLFLGDPPHPAHTKNLRTITSHLFSTPKKSKDIQKNEPETKSHLTIKNRGDL